MAASHRVSHRASHPPSHLVSHRLAATFDAVAPLEEGAARGVTLGFLPDRGRPDLARIDDLAELGPTLDLAAVVGIGKVLRLLRAARIVLPREPLALAGRPAEAARLLERALGTRVRLEVRPRSRLRFVAWTEAGLEVVPDVTDVLESEEAYLVLRRGGRPPLRMLRSSVTRRRTEVERWWEVTGIERLAPAPWGAAGADHA